ncbi:hypothetical protein Q9L58_007429 [Maublancomyces gigas]|uniref:Uncharacterized protein n=1 Tax=Discina gigas TaxID=1032678 RepID=A0ABR3GCG4_9PEZI
MEYNSRTSSSFFAQHAQSSSSSSGTPGSSSAGSGASNPRSSAPQFDVISWYPKYQSCQRYFLEVAQHTYPCQALAAFINIKLPFQRSPSSNSSSSNDGTSTAPPSFRAASGAYAQHQYGCVSLHPYIRRLVATGFDVAAILHGWFGDEWGSGVGPLHEQERRNYLFAAKSGGWASVKKEYDVVVDEAVPYLMPLSEVDNAEIEGAERLWSRWLAMEDWMLGARAPGQSEMQGC